jgi:hypothetical protein
MQIETGPGGTIVTNPDRRLFALMSLKGRLNIEINTGLKHSRGSTITAARGWGYTGPNRKQKCLDWTIAELDRREQQLFKFTPPARLAQMVRSRYSGGNTWALCAVIDSMESNGEVTTPAEEENSQNYWDQFWTDGRINR